MRLCRRRGVDSELMSTIAIIDYGMSNLRSVFRALQQVSECRVIVTSEPREIRRADRVVFPGQAAIRDCMEALRGMDLVGVILEAARSKPLLGMCLGPQALLDFSEENDGVACLGVLPGRVVRFGADLRDNSGQRLKVPHMGWNQVEQVRPHPLWQGIDSGAWFYFVHSYFLQPAESALVTGETVYGTGFASVIARENIFAAQFHPEKSARDGLRLLANFARWNP